MPINFFINEGPGRFVGIDDRKSVPTDIGTYDADGGFFTITLPALEGGPFYDNKNRIVTFIAPGTEAENKVEDYAVQVIGFTGTTYVLAAEYTSATAAPIVWLEPAGVDHPGHSFFQVTTKAVLDATANTYVMLNLCVRDGVKRKVKFTRNLEVTA